MLKDQTAMNGDRGRVSRAIALAVVLALLGPLSWPKAQALPAAGLKPPSRAAT